MTKLLATCLVLALASCSSPRANPESSVPGGHARFELFGMLDEYLYRQMDGDLIERFYESEPAAADHFEPVLREFCAEESLPTHWRRKADSVGHIYFYRHAVAAAINRNYAPRENIYGASSPPVGTLDPAVFRSASKADMLRYVFGSYVRWGDYESKHRAVFRAPNLYEKFLLLADVLGRLGCSNIRLYNNADSGLIPTSYLLTFCPSDEIRAVTGIRREVGPAELKIWMSKSLLKEIKRPHVL